MLEALGQNPQSKSLYASDRFIATLSVREHTWQITDFANPAAVLFLFKLDCQLHSTGSHRSQSNKEGRYLPNVNSTDLYKPFRATAESRVVT